MDTTLKYKSDETVETIHSRLRFLFEVIPSLYMGDSYIAGESGQGCHMYI